MATTATSSAESAIRMAMPLSRRLMVVWVSSRAGDRHGRVPVRAR